jgi:transcriptional regulator with XRE-family HTH domain
MTSETKRSETKGEPPGIPRPGHYIKEWRIHRGLTQAEVAQKMKFTNGALSQLETGRTSYRQEMLEELAVALDCQPGDLLFHPRLYLLHSNTPEELEMVARILEVIKNPQPLTDESLPQRVTRREKPDVYVSGNYDEELRAAAARAPSVRVRKREKPAVASPKSADENPRVRKRAKAAGAAEEKPRGVSARVRKRSPSK